MYVYIRNISKRILTKYLRRSVLLLYAKRSQMTTKPKTHYETLGISPTSTFNEIKTAYYELTLKYHPDKNKSEFAKEKFQEISDAYDILSRYDTRKQYDKTLQIKYGHLYQKHEKIKRYETKEMEFTSKNIYNFDDWLQNHYTMLFERKKQMKTELEAGHMQSKVDNEGKHLIAFYLLVFFISLLFVCMVRLRESSKRGKE